MGFLDQVIGGLVGGQGSGGNSAIGDAIKELLAPGAQQSSAQNHPAPGMQQRSQGGLEGLLDSLTRAGHGDLADSWVSTGQNRPLAPEQLEQSLDRDTIENLSRRTGLPRDELLRQLSQHLPKAVDSLTPQGRRPSREDMGHW